MTTKTIDERLDVVEERLFEICTVSPDIGADQDRFTADFEAGTRVDYQLEQDFNLGMVGLARRRASKSRRAKEFLCSSCSHMSSTEKLGLTEWVKGAHKAVSSYAMDSIQLTSTLYEPIILRKAFEHAVLKQVMIDAPVGVLLFGGFTLSQVNGAKEISALVIGYMEFGKLEFVGKMFPGCDHQTSTLRTRCFFGAEVLISLYLLVIRG
ncbi:hypothetical protein PanWU01x14_105320 [Parasponia andersonii]|uniref:Uncharacterized protein n=1 Tax=Parasponia andersonii TaxID=3476 RepID=A0A2P5D1M6_PARAD|nr:hypothetical protein PanWU01x14_105320 [Parasponia andersonii]